MTPKNRKRTLAAMLGGALGIVGIGLAAALLSISISGSTGYADTNGGIAIAAASGTKGETVDCTATTKVNDNAFRVRAVVQRVNGEVQPGSCELTVSIKNPGNTPVALTGATLNVPGGWTWAATSAPTGTIPAGDSVAFKAKLTASADAAAGEVTGSINAKMP